MRLETLFPKAFGRGSDDPPAAELSGDSLIIDCRGCRYAPDPGSSECIACMVGSMCRAGGADRVVLRTGRDVEVSGRAGRVLKEVASIRRWSTPAEEPRGRCRACPASRSELVAAAWERFPSPMTDGLLEPLAGGVPDREGCAECAARTRRALEQMDEGVERVRRAMAESYRVVR